MSNLAQMYDIKGYVYGKNKWGSWFPSSRWIERYEIFIAAINNETKDFIDEMFEWLECSCRNSYYVNIHHPYRGAFCYVIHFETSYDYAMAKIRFCDDIANNDHT